MTEVSVKAQNKEFEKVLLIYNNDTPADIRRNSGIPPYPGTVPVTGFWSIQP